MATIVVDKPTRSVRAYDKEGGLLAFYPATIGSEEKPAPRTDVKSEDEDSLRPTATPSAPQPADAPASLAKLRTIALKRANGPQRNGRRLRISAVRSLAANETSLQVRGSAAASDEM